jgi:ABC-type phosphate transport system substrate-binding protein
LQKKSVWCEKYALGGAEEAAGLALTEDSSGTVRKTIADTPGTVGYLALSYIDDSVKALRLNGIAPLKNNIENGKYPVWSYEHMANRRQRPYERLSHRLESRFSLKASSDNKTLIQCLTYHNLLLTSLP